MTFLLWSGDRCSGNAIEGAMCISHHREGYTRGNTCGLPFVLDALTPEGGDALGSPEGVQR